MNKIPYFHIPKQLLTKEYNDFSVQSKVLFAMIFTNAERTKDISETAKLIEAIDPKELNSMRKSLQQIKCDEREGK